MAYRLTTRARCLRCPWAQAGDWAGTDRAAEKHNKDTTHPTATVTEAIR